MKRIVFFCFFGSLFVAVPVFAKGLPVTVSDLVPRQGDTIVVNVGEHTAAFDRAEFGGKPLEAFSYNGGLRILVPLAATEPIGRRPLSVFFKDGVEFMRTVTVRARKFDHVVLPVPQKISLTPQELLANILVTKVSLDEVVALKTNNIFFAEPFIQPLKNKTPLSSTFGEVRQTGSQQVRHLGIDFSAKQGTEVIAVNSGIVRKAYYDKIYGNSVILDHGEGIFSLYLHLKSFNVHDGDAVPKGMVIGTVGSTGYATAPHLHLSLKVNGISVDPLAFIAAFK